MKATEAAKIADKATSESTNMMFQTALHLIERKANEGEHYAVTAYLNAFAAVELENLGYSVNAQVDRDGSRFFRISW